LWGVLWDGLGINIRGFECDLFTLVDFDVTVYVVAVGRLIVDQCYRDGDRFGDLVERLHEFKAVLFGCSPLVAVPVERSKE
jgi:hypothetical protein